MKKSLLTAMAATLLIGLCGAESQAFLLPPFKKDISVGIQKKITTVKTKVAKLQAKIEESTFIQTAIQYGKGAKEFYDYSKTLDSYKDVDFKEVGSIASKLKKVNKKKTDAQNKAAQDADNETKTSEKKIAEIDRNIQELEQDTLAHPEHAAKNMKKITKLQKKKEKLKEDRAKKLAKIKEDSEKTLKSLEDAKDQLLESAAGTLTKITSIAGNYDSTEDLKGTVSMISPSEDTEVTTNVVLNYRKLYYSFFWEDMATVLNRTAIIRMDIENDNKKAKDSEEKSSDLEGSSAAKTAAAIELKKMNMLALINYTELVLPQLKLDISHDLANSGFNKINADTAISNFNFDNYKFDPSRDKYEVETTPATEYKEEAPLDPSLLDASKDPLQKTLKSISDYAEQERKNAPAAGTDATAQSATEGGDNK